MQARLVGSQAKKYILERTRLGVIDDCRQGEVGMMYDQSYE